MHRRHGGVLRLAQSQRDGDLNTDFQPGVIPLALLAKPETPEDLVALLHLALALSEKLNTQFAALDAQLELARIQRDTLKPKP